MSTSGRITREKFDAMVKEKVERYGMNVDDAIQQTIQQCRFQGPPRPSMRAEGFSYDNPYWNDEYNQQPFPSMEYDASCRRFQAGPQYGPSSLPSGERGGHHFEHPGPSRPKFLCPEDRGKFYKSINRVKRENPPIPVGDGQDGLSKIKKGHKKIKRTEPTEESDIMSKFGSQIIKWAGFNSIQNDSIFKEQHETLFKVATESCAKTLAAYKCSIKEAQQDFCYFSFNNAKNAALRTPSIDNDLLSMLKEKNVIQSRNGFIELLNPVDKELMTVQARLLKAGIPLLMACNAYEIDQKTEGLKSVAQLSNALEKSISLCRKSLVLVGQTFAFVSTCRQEKILDLLGLNEKAPKPAGFPNLDDSALFGKEYLTYLKIWMENTGCNFKLKKEEQAVEGNGKTSVKQEMVEKKESSSEDKPTDMTAAEPAEGKEIPVLETSEDKDNPILTAIKELNAGQSGEESQEMAVLQALKASLLKKEESPADDTDTKEEAEISLMETGKQGVETPGLQAGTMEGMEIPVLQTREERMKHISPKPRYLGPSQMPGSEQGQIQQLMSVRRGSTYKFAQTGANLSNLLTFPESQPKPSVCKADEDSQPLQAENLKAMETIDHLMNSAVTTTKGKLNDQEKPPFWFLFDESSMEYKYYRLKLAQFQRLRKITLEVGIQAKLLKAAKLKAERLGGGASKHKKVKRTSRTTQTVLSAAVMLQARRAQVSTKLKSSQFEQARSKHKLSITEGHLSKIRHPEKRSRSEASRSSLSLAKRQRSNKPKLTPTSGSSLPVTQTEKYSSCSRVSHERDSRSERHSLSGSSGSSRERSSTSKCHQSEKHTGVASHKKDPNSKLSHVKNHSRSEEPSVAELNTTTAATSLSELAKSSEQLSESLKISKGGDADSHAPEPAKKSETIMATQLLGVDLKTMDTADKLAQFVAQVGPEIEKFSRENIANNPEFWFLNSKGSAAYRYYRMKVTEVCRSMGKSSYLETLKAQEDEVNNSDSESTMEEPMIVEQQQEESGTGLQESKIPGSPLPVPQAQEVSTKVQVPPLALKALEAPLLAEQAALLVPQAQEASVPASQGVGEATILPLTEAEESPVPASTEIQGEQMKEIKEERELTTYTDESESGLKEPNSEETELIKPELEVEETSSQPSEETEMKEESEDEAPDIDDSPTQETGTPVHGPVTRKRGRPLQQSASSPTLTEEAQVEDPGRASTEKLRGRPGRPRKTKPEVLESDSKTESSPGMALRKKGAKESPATASTVKLGSATSGEGLGVAGNESMDDTL